ncbi:hypothetical protein H2203_000308 [Taxawa tesnikishii (nom. ined.)]|nr:hypothetical protein H2203_000308 [Dothideales sp. JES 119]
MSGYVHDEFSMEEGQMKDLNIHDRSPSGSVELLLGAKAGMKRRASSPHQESTPLPNVEAAFHTSIANGGATDVCGYCGQDFPNPAQWDVRREHINQTHKFGECNQAKKFYRADHFRQHLKHSHGGASGKWTNMLETACMREEPLPTPLKERPPAQAITAANPAQAPPAPTAPMIAMQAVLGASDRPEVIDEVPHET